MITLAHIIALQDIRARPHDLRRATEPFRQRVIDLGMLEPPLVDVDADRVFITEAGKDYLAAREGRGEWRDGMPSVQR